MSRHALLAFSGGLDTSFCVLWLRDQGYTVSTVTVDTGGFPPAELKRIEELSATLGAERHVTINAQAELYDRYLRYLIYGNVLRGGLYPLSVSAERVCQAARVVAVAKEIGANTLVHGSTGAGNDQVRFDVAFRALAPEMAMITPIRELALSRDEEMAFIASKGIVMPEKIRSYSINEGLWGTSIGGAETHNPWSELPEQAYPGGAIDDSQAPMTLTVGFTQGVPTSLDGQEMDAVALITRLNELGRQYGIGRGVHLGDTILGIKGRVGFEAPAAHLLITAHRELEKLVLTGKQLFWKEQMGNLYGTLLHEGHFFDPLARDIEAFLKSSQRGVTGEARLRLHPRTFEVLGIQSPFALMNTKIAAYGEGTRLWTGSEAAGFSKLYGVSQLLAMQAGSNPFEVQ
nr:argininosuccinate synthase [uncultured Holophaga sp.]